MEVSWKESTGNLWDLTPHLGDIISHIPYIYIIYIYILKMINSIISHDIPNIKSTIYLIWTIFQGCFRWDQEPTSTAPPALRHIRRRHVQVHLLHSDQKPHMQFFGPGQVPDLPLSGSQEQDLLVQTVFPPPEKVNQIKE